jgi:peptide chain release factor subunit 1
MDTKDKQKLKRFVKNLDSFRGRHTELVSVYIPAGYDLNKIINHLFQEQGTASNIKDKKTRENVITSLEKMIRHLRLFKRTPANGLAVFSGNISEKEGQPKIEVFSIEPPEQLKTRIYRCDQTFVTSILKEFMDDKETYGLIVIDRREGTIGLLKGTNIVELADFTSNVPGKTTKGGQSQQRYARLREEAAHEFFKKVGSTANKEFLEMKELKGILVGGPGHTKEDFLNGDYLNNNLKTKVIGTKDLSYTGSFGLNELVDKSSDVLTSQVIIEEKKVLQEFFQKLATESDKVSYGMKEVKHVLEMGAVKTLLLSETLDDKDLDELEKLAEQSGTDVKIISTETREGVQLKEMGEIAAILRFPVY